MKSNEIRAKFLEFFASKNHQIVSSAPMVLKDDPSLLFTNAGMNQFKEYFLGNTKPNFNRAVDSQKCLRVSGKHNDLEEVGKDTYHHTMFEMLGNWSFGDYFKEEAIHWAWELLTEVFEIPKENLYATVFEGDTADGTGEDTEAYAIWKTILPEEQILLGDKSDNFWEMGDQGPCGPASEIHIDIRSKTEKEKIPGRELVNKDHPLVVEIWNLVFMQFNRKADGSLVELPAKHIDTGMGFERLCMVMQEKKSNYDTDVFTPIIHEIEKITTERYGVSEEKDIAIRVIADHVRAVTFAIADGQLPSNGGAGYVIRRILRRAIRYGFTFLNTKKPFIYELVNTLTAQMGHAFPELEKQQSLCENVIREEEQAFLKTLDQGLSLLDEVMEKATSKSIAGKKAFELYDTFGFPIDLTALILSENGFTYGKTEFETELQKQKNRSRSAAKSTTGDWTVVAENDHEEFIGYDELKAQVKLVKYRSVVDKKKGQRYQLVFNQTPFYPEGGGQVGDQGYLKDQQGHKLNILDTKKENNLIIHWSDKLPEDTSVNFTAVVDVEKRKKSMANHSATHLLHQALRSVLGTHVEQKGSLVSPDRLRFDFSHFSKMTTDELQKVEDFVNARITEQLPLEEQRAISYDQALKEGAIALFGEKYGDKVRAIRFGKSMELCGGTHVKNTAAIWHFKLLSESGVASGVRRVEAITGQGVKKFFAAQTALLAQIERVFKNPQDLLKTVTRMQAENADLHKQIEHLKHEKAGQLKKTLKADLEQINGVQFIARKVDMTPDEMKDLAYQLGGEVDNLFAFFASEQQGKALLTCYVSKKLAEEKDLNAGQVVREMGKLIQGGGGGQAFFATAGGKNTDGIPETLIAVKKFVS